MVFFDLPTFTDSDRREYRKFRSFLLKNGFIMMQESIYIKLSVNGASAEQIRNQVKKNLPKDGLIQLLTITEKQFSDIEFLLGDKNMVYCDSDKRYLEL